MYPSKHGDFMGFQWDFMGFHGIYEDSGLFAGASRTNWISLAGNKQ